MSRIAYLWSVRIEFDDSSSSHLAADDHLMLRTLSTFSLSLSLSLSPSLSLSLFISLWTRTQPYRLLLALPPDLQHGRSARWTWPFARTTHQETQTRNLYLRGQR